MLARRATIRKPARRQAKRTGSLPPKSLGTLGNGSKLTTLAVHRATTPTAIRVSFTSDTATCSIGNSTDQQILSLLDSDRPHRSQMKWVLENLFHHPNLHYTILTIKTGHLLAHQEMLLLNDHHYLRPTLFSKYVSCSSLLCFI